MGDVDGVPPYHTTKVPPGTTLKTQELYVGQAIEFCKTVLKDKSRPDSDRALAICWLCHLVADSHHPCHAGSLYVEDVFPDGDRGANSIRIKQGRNMHSLWDGLLGRGYDPGDIRRRITEIRSEQSLLQTTGLKPSIETDPMVWLKESRELSKTYVYTPEVLEPITVAMRAGSTEVATVNLPEGYLKRAGRVAQLRAIQASERLARVLSEGL